MTLGLSDVLVVGPSCHSMVWLGPVGFLMLAMIPGILCQLNLNQMAPAIPISAIMPSVIRSFFFIV